MEKNSETSAIIEKKDKGRDYSGYSEKQSDLDVDVRNGQLQQQKRSQIVTQKGLGQQSDNQTVGKKTVTVFQKNNSDKAS